MNPFQPLLLLSSLSPTQHWEAIPCHEKQFCYYFTCAASLCAISSYPSTVVRSAKVALLIGISICGICCLSHSPLLFFFVIFSPFLAQHARGLMQLGRYLNHHQSLIQSQQTHTKLRYSTHNSLHKMFVHGVHRHRRGAIEGVAVKITPTPPPPSSCLPSRLFNSRIKSRKTNAGTV